MAIKTALTGARSWATAADWSGGVGPVDNVDSAVIPANCQMLMNQDQSAWTGLLGLTIASHATTPGMLYWLGATGGILRLKTTFNIAGDATSSVCKGRLLANSTGLWTGSTATATAGFAASQAGIGGSVSAGNVFTPTAAAWVVDALINESIIINGTSYVISDNDATTITLTSGPGALTVTSWSLVIRPLPVSNLCRIILGATSKIVTQYLDLALYATEPTLKSVRTYGTTENFTANSGTDVLTLASTLATILVDKCPVYVSSSVTLPAPLSATTLYYVRDVSGATCKLYTVPTGGSPIDLSDTGSGVHVITTGIVPMSTTISSNQLQAHDGTTAIALPATPWAANEKVMFTWPSGTGPYTSGAFATLQKNNPYCIMALSTDRFTITEVSGGTALTISGSLPANTRAYLGGKATTLLNIAVLDDVNSDAAWGATAGSTFAATLGLSAVVLADTGPANYSQQRLGLVAKTAYSMKFSAAVSLAKFPNAQIILCSRNVGIQSASTTSAVLVVDGTSNTTGGRVGELRSTVGTGVTFYGYGLAQCNSFFAAVISGCNCATETATGCTVGIVAACGNGFTSSTSCVAMLIAGCAYGVLYGTNLVVTTIFGCTNGFNSNGNSFATMITGCNWGMNAATNCLATTIQDCVVAISGNGNSSSAIIGCTQAVQYGGHTLRGTVFSNNPINVYSARVVCYGAEFVFYAPGYRMNQFYVPFGGSNPSGMFSFDHNHVSGTLYWSAQGGSGSSAAYVEGTHGDLQGCGWTAPDPDYIHTSANYTDAIPAGAMTCPNYIDIPVHVADGETAKFQVAMKPSTISGWTAGETPRLQLVNAGKAWNSGGTFAEVISTSAHSLGGTTWELLTVTHTATANQQLAIRITGKRLTINESFQWCYRQLLDYPATNKVETGVNYGNAYVGNGGTFGGGTTIVVEALTVSIGGSPVTPVPY